MDDLQNQLLLRLYHILKVQIFQEEPNQEAFHEIFVVVDNIYEQK